MISVIIPTYNRPETLFGRAIPSVLAQTVSDWECHVIGDGTDDVTCERMAELCRSDARFRFTNLPHSSPERWGLQALAARNYGLDHARGEWIAALDDDDEWEPDHHAILLEAAAGADHVYGLSMTWQNGHPTGQVYGAWPPGDGQFCNGANLYRASLPYRYDLDCWSRGRPGDADLWLRMYEGGVSFAFTPRWVLRYHRNWP